MDAEIAENPTKVHHGRNVKRFREMLGVKQEAIALELNITQQAVSKLEQKALLDDETIVKIAKVLNVPAEAIKYMNDDSTNSYINTFNDQITNHGTFMPTQYYNFNPIEKIVQLYDEKIKILENTIKEKNELIERLLNK